MPKKRPSLRKDENEVAFDIVRAMTGEGLRPEPQRAVVYALASADLTAAGGGDLTVAYLRGTQSTCPHSGYRMTAGGSGTR